MLTIFDGLMFTLFEADFPFRLPHAVGESGKRKWELEVGTGWGGGGGGTGLGFITPTTVRHHGAERSSVLTN